MLLPPPPPHTHTTATTTTTVQICTHARTHTCTHAARKSHTRKLPQLGPVSRRRRVYNHHTRELISARKTSHTYNNKDMSRLSCTCLVYTVYAYIRGYTEILWGGKKTRKKDRKLEKKKPDPQKAEWHNNQILTVATMISTFDHGQIGLTTPRPSLSRCRMGTNHKL